IAAHRWRRKWDLPGRAVVLVPFALAGALAAFAPAAYGWMKPIPPVPDVIAQELQKTPRGKVTVVDFVDYECPFCRMTHVALAPLLAANESRVRVVRKNVPLRMHPHAMDAARAACCGERLGKGDAMADALFTAPTDELTVDGCEKIAAALGLPLEGFR